MSCFVFVSQTLAWVEKSEEDDPRPNNTFSVHDADLLQTYLKRELNYTSRVVLNALRNKMYWFKVAVVLDLTLHLTPSPNANLHPNPHRYWFKVAKRMHRAADTQKVDPNPYA